MSLYDVTQEHERDSISDVIPDAPGRLLLQRLMANRSFFIGLFLVAFLIGLALLGPLMIPYDPFQMEVSKRLTPPSADHWLGTDNFGRDLFARVVYGARASLIVGLSVSVLTSVIGFAMGLYASYYRILDHLFMRIADGLMSFPSILLAIALMAAFGARLENVIIALSIVFTPYTARIVRSAALRTKNETFVEAAKTIGLSDFMIIWRHIAPNVLAPLIVQATYVFADSIIVEATLSFIGAGIPAPEPSWGNILYDGKSVIYKAWWMTVFPAMMVILSVLGLNLLGDGLRDAIDPHTGKND